MSLASLPNKELNLETKWLSQEFPTFRNIAQQHQQQQAPTIHEALDDSLNDYKKLEEQFIGFQLQDPASKDQNHQQHSNRHKFKDEDDADLVLDDDAADIIEDDDIESLPLYLQPHQSPDKSLQKQRESLAFTEDKSRNSAMLEGSRHNFSQTMQSQQDGGVFLSWSIDEGHGIKQQLQGHQQGKQPHQLVASVTEQSQILTPSRNEQLYKNMTFDNLVKTDMPLPQTPERKQVPKASAVAHDVRGDELLERIKAARSKALLKEKMFGKDRRSSNQKISRRSNSRDALFKRLYDDSISRRKQGQIIEDHIAGSDFIGQPKINEMSQRLASRRRSQKSSLDSLAGKHIFDNLYQDSKVRNNHHQFNKIMKDELEDIQMRQQQYKVSASSIAKLELRNKQRMKEFIQEKCNGSQYFQLKYLQDLLLDLEIIMLEAPERDKKSNSTHKLSKMSTLDDEPMIVRLSRKFILDLSILLFTHPQQLVETKTLKKVIQAMMSVKTPNADKKKMIIKVLKNDKVSKDMQKQIIDSLLAGYQDIRREKKLLKPMEQPTSRFNIWRNKSQAYLHQVARDREKDYQYSPNISKRSQDIDLITRLERLANRLPRDEEIKQMEESSKSIQNIQIGSFNDISPINPSKFDQSHFTPEKDKAKMPTLEEDDSIIPDDEDMSPVKSYFKGQEQQQSQPKEKQKKKSQSRSKSVKRHEILYNEAKIRKTLQDNGTLEFLGKRDLRQHKLMEAGKFVLLKSTEDPTLREKYEEIMTQSLLEKAKKLGKKTQRGRKKSTQKKPISTSAVKNLVHSKSSLILSEKKDSVTGKAAGVVRQESSPVKNLLYQVDIDINKERKISLQLFEGDNLESVLEELKLKHSLSEHNVEKIANIIRSKIRRGEE